MVKWLILNSSAGTQKKDGNEMQTGTLEQKTEKLHIKQKIEEPERQKKNQEDSSQIDCKNRLFHVRSEIGMLLEDEIFLLPQIRTETRREDESFGKLKKSPSSHKADIVTTPSYARILHENRVETKSGACALKLRNVISRFTKLGVIISSTAKRDLL